MDDDEDEEGDEDDQSDAAPKSNKNNLSTKKRSGSPSKTTDISKKAKAANKTSAISAKKSADDVFMLVYKDGNIKALSSQADIGPYLAKGFVVRQFRTKQEMTQFRLKYKAGMKNDAGSVGEEHNEEPSTPTRSKTPSSPPTSENRSRGAAQRIAIHRGDAIPVHYVSYPGQNLLIVVVSLEMQYNNGSLRQVRNMFRFRPNVMVPTTEEFSDQLKELIGVYNLEIRAVPHSDDDAGRFNPDPPKSNDGATTIWNDEAMVFVISFNSNFEKAQSAVESFTRKYFKLIQTPVFKECLVSACKVFFRTGKIAEQLSNDDDYFWEFLHTVQPNVMAMPSLDYRLHDQVIKELFTVLPSKEYIDKPERTMPRKLKQFFYRSGVLSPDIQVHLGDDAE